MLISRSMSNIAAVRAVIRSYTNGVSLDDIDKLFGVDYRTTIKIMHRYYKRVATRPEFSGYVAYR